MLQQHSGCQECSAPGQTLPCDSRSPDLEAVAWPSVGNDCLSAKCAVPESAAAEAHLRRDFAHDPSL